MVLEDKNNHFRNLLTFLRGEERSGCAGPVQDGLCGSLRQRRGLVISWPLAASPHVVVESEDCFWEQRAASCS